jgi:hypothetical protein
MQQEPLNLVEFQRRFSYNYLAVLIEVTSDRKLRHSMEIGAESSRSSCS